MRESNLVSDIIRALYPIAQLERHNVGVFATKDGKKINTGLPKGFPDLSGHRLRDGKAVYLEVKIDDNEPSEEQRAYLCRMAEGGAIAAVCWSVEDARELVRRGGSKCQISQ